jgi:hypothetical protein
MTPARACGRFLIVGAHRTAIGFERFGILALVEHHPAEPKLNVRRLRGS